MLIYFLEKYLLALKCLNAARELDPENPKLHEQAIRFHRACKSPHKLLPISLTWKSVTDITDLPAVLLEGLKSKFYEIIPADADLKAYNSEWQQKHSQSTPHQQSAYHVKYLLDNSTKGQAEEGLKKLLDESSITSEDALAGLKYLDEWKSDEATKTAYKEAAAKKWPEATVFQK